MKDSFEAWLERELDTALGTTLAGHTAPATPRYAVLADRQKGRATRLLTGLPVAAGAKAAAGLCVAALAAGGGAAVLAGSHAASHASSASSASTRDASDDTADQDQGGTAGTPSATGHGAAVTEAVASCRAAVASATPGPGSQGIGRCVSAVASGGRAHAGGTTTHPTGRPEATPPAEGDHPTSPAHPTPAAHPTPPDHPTPPAASSSGA